MPCQRKLQHDAVMGGQQGASGLAVDPAARESRAEIADRDVAGGAEGLRPSGVDPASTHIRTMTSVPVILPSAVEVEGKGKGKGTVTFLYTTRSADLVALCASPERAPNANIPPLQPRPDPVGGFRLRAYNLDLPDEEGRFVRIFRRSTMMVNIRPRCIAPHDGAKVSPHFHATFEQVSLTLKGEFEHFLRWP